MNFKESVKISLIPSKERIEYLSTKNKDFIIDYYLSLDLDISSDFKVILIENLLNEEDLFKIILTQINHHNFKDIALTSYIKDDFKIQVLIDAVAEIPDNEASHVLTFLINRLTLPRIAIKNILKYQNRITFEIFSKILNYDDTIKISMINVANNHLKILLILSLNNPKLQHKYISHFKEEELLTLCKEFSNDQFTSLIIPYINSHPTLLKLINSMMSDQYLKLSLKYVTQKRDIVEIIKKIKDKNIKRELINLYDLNDSLKYYIIKSIKNDNTRSSLADYYFPLEEKIIFTDDYNKTFVIPEYLDSLPPELYFGTEIECFGKSSYGILLYPNIIQNKFVTKEEETVNMGVEFTSKKLTWYKSDLESIYQICDFINLNHLKTDNTCGCHFHFDAGYLTSLDSWKWLYYLYIKFESILYLIANEENTLPRQGIKNYAQPISKLFTDNLWHIFNSTSIEEFIKKINSLFETKIFGLDLSHIKSIGTLEFRISNGTINPNIIIENILLFGSLIILAEKLSHLPLTKDLYLLITKLDLNELSEEEKLKILLELLFKDDKLKNSFKKRYDSNKKLYDQIKNKAPQDEQIKSFSFSKAGIII